MLNICPIKKKQKSLGSIASKVILNYQDNIVDYICTSVLFHLRTVKKMAHISIICFDILWPKKKRPTSYFGFKDHNSTNSKV